jgi:hypothetical protein
MRDMQLRIHPKMNWEGFPNWPPAWAGSGAEEVFPGEEGGVLTGVEMTEAGTTLPRHLVLTMMHLGKGSSAVLFCDDEEKVVPRLFEVLKGCVGWEIDRIGDLDVDL